MRGCLVVALALLELASFGASGPPVPAPRSPRIVEVRVLPGVLDLARWDTRGPVRLSLSAMDAPGSRSKALRAEVSLTEEAYRASSFAGQVLTFSVAQDWSAYNRLVQWVYVEPSVTPRGAAVSLHLYNEDGVRRTTGTYVVPRGRWNEVVWDITPMRRESIRILMVTQGTERHNPGEADRNVFHLGRIELRHVEPPTAFHGWGVPAGRAAFSHVGYMPGGDKQVIFGGAATGPARLIDVATGRGAWRGKLVAVSHPRTGRFKVADLSRWRRPGRYVLVAQGPDGPIVTEPFAIGPDIYRDVVRRVFDFYRAERCGAEAPGHHLPCHLDDARIEPQEGMPREQFPPEVRALFGRHVDCSGGWHDAGDWAKFARQEYNSAFQMGRIYERGLRYARPGGRHDAILDEATWGVRYALKTLLPTGRDCDRPQSVFEGPWTDCVPGNSDDRHAHMTTWNVVEYFIVAVAAEALAARILKHADPAFAGRCLAQAKREAEAYLTGSMKDWRGGWLPARYAAVGLAFLELYRATGDPRYRQQAVTCGDELVACQEQSLAWNDAGVTGFWYDGPQRQHPFAGEAGDGEHAYLLAELCRQFPDHPSWMRWYAALRIYATFYAGATSRWLAPYGIPAHSLRDGPEQPYPYWDHATLLDGTSQRLQFQFDQMVRLGSRYLVRIRDANSALNMSAATLGATADIARDPRAQAIAERCFQWMFGRNPFSRSQIWGIGYRYREQPHYVHAHGEMPGSIALKGIDGRLDGDPVMHDEPYSDPLPRCVINEVCITQAAHFLNAARELAFRPRVSGVVRGTKRPPAVVARFATTPVREIVARAPIRSGGAYALTLPGPGLYDIQCGPVTRREFIASATNRRGFDLDLDREIALSIECPQRVRPVVPFRVVVSVQALGRHPAWANAAHTVALRLHNVACSHPQQRVNLSGRRPARLSFALVPERALEPFLVVAVPDGQMEKRAAFMGVVGEGE